MEVKKEKEPKSKTKENASHNALVQQLQSQLESFDVHTLNETSGSASKGTMAE
jgi:hypothetical protein